MPALPADAFAERLRDLPAAELTAFCAAVWSARGWETEVRPDGAVAAERGDERAVVAPVPAGLGARLPTLLSDGAPVPEDATVIVAPGRLPTAVPEGAEVLDAADLHGMVLYGLSRERADELLRAHLGVPATVPPDFVETALDRALSALTAATAVPYAREAGAAVFVAVLVLGVAVALPSGTGPAGDPSASGGGGTGDTDENATPTTVELAEAGELRANTSYNWTVGLGNSPGEWPAFGGGPNRTAWRPGVSGPKSGPSERLNQSLDTPVVASPAVVNGTVYAGSYGGIFRAYGTTEDDGLELRWSLPLGGGITSSPAVQGDTVYVGTVESITPTTNSLRDRRNLYALNATSGAVRWGYVLPSVRFSSPVVAGNTVYVGGTGGSVHAVNATDGHARWRTALGGEIYASPAVVDGTVYAAGSNGAIAALNATDGRVVWERNASTFLGSSPAVRDGRVYLGTERGEVLALDAASGATIWNVSVNGTVYSSPAATPDRVYVGTENGSLYALNASTGATEWRRAPGDRVFSSPAVANGTVYVGVAGANGSVLALDAESGTTEWRHDTAGQVTSSPAVVPGAVVVGDFSGHLYVLKRDGGLSAVAREILERRKDACGDPACRDAFARALDNETENGTALVAATPPERPGAASESEPDPESASESASGSGPDVDPGPAHSSVMASPASSER